jgi:hypothetical protein
MLLVHRILLNRRAEKGRKGEWNQWSNFPISSPPFICSGIGEPQIIDVWDSPFFNLLLQTLSVNSYESRARLYHIKRVLIVSKGDILSTAGHSLKDIGRLVRIVSRLPYGRGSITACIGIAVSRPCCSIGGEIDIVRRGIGRRIHDDRGLDGSCAHVDDGCFASKRTVDQIDTATGGPIKTDINNPDG